MKIKPLTKLTLGTILGILCIIGLIYIATPPDITVISQWIEKSFEDISSPQTSSFDTTEYSQQEIIDRIQSSSDKILFDIERIVDGDTIVITGLGTIRLIGIDTPETKDPRKPVQCFGEEATTYAQEFFKDSQVYIEFNPVSTQDKYQRILAYVYREDGVLYNRQVIQDGYAFSYKTFAHPKLDEFNTLEQKARIKKIGLWDKNNCPEYI